MRRGDLVVVALQGDSGKPRLALIIQTDLFQALATVTVLPLTSALQEAALLRIDVTPTQQNGLAVPCQIAVDRPTITRRAKLGPIIGHLDDTTLLAVNRALSVFLGLA